MTEKKPGRPKIDIDDYVSEYFGNILFQVDYTYVFQLEMSQS